MTILSNSYVEKVNSEHPIAVWMLNEQVDYISLITDADREFEDSGEWTLTNATAVAETPSIDTPLSDYHVSRILGNGVALDPSGGNITATSVSTYPAASFVESLGNVSLGFYLYLDNDKATSISYGYQYYDASILSTIQVLETTAIAPEDANTWKFFATTFDIPPVIATNIQLYISISVASGGGTGSGDYNYIISGLTFGQWSEEFHKTSAGVIPELVSTTAANDIAIPNTLKVIEAVPYGTSGISGYYLANDELYANNYGIPLVFGSSNVTKIYPNVQSGTAYPSLIFPGYGFLNERGRYNIYTAEMWIRINTDSIEPHKIFGPIASNDGLYVEGGFLTFVLGNDYVSHFVGEWMRPMLVHIIYVKNRISLLVNGEQVGTFEYDQRTVNLPAEFNGSNKNQDWVGFYASDDVHPIDIDSYAIYSYAVPTQVAKRRFVWGQGVVAPEQTNSALNANTAFIDYGYSNYAVNYNYPDFADWRQAYFSNVNTSSNLLQLPNYQLPTFNLDEKTVDEWYEDILAITPATSVRTNLIINPSVETNLTGIFINSGSYVRSTAASYIGSASVLGTASGGASFGTWFTNGISTNRITVSAGTTYTFSGYIKDINTSVPYAAFLYFYNSGGSLISAVPGTVATPTTTGWTRFSVTTMAPVGAVTCTPTLYVSNASPAVAGTQAYFDGFLLEASSSLLPYFDGGYTSLTANYNPVTAWTGTAHNSTSTLTAIADSDDADDRKYLTFRPNAGWNSENCSILFNRFNILNERIESIYGVFKTDGTAVNQPVFKLYNTLNTDFLLVKINGTTLTYSIKINGTTTTLATRTITANQKFTAGINITNLSSQQISGIKNFFSNQTRYALYIGGDGTTTFTGRIYKFGFDAKYNNRYLTSLYDSTGIFSHTTVNAETMYNHVANYTLTAIAKYGILFADIAVAAYWEDYMPLTYFAKYVEDYAGEKYFDFDMLQINLDYPEPLETTSIEFTEAWTYGELKAEYATPVQLTYAELDNNIYTGWDDYEDMAQQSVKYYYYDTERSALRSYISFQKIADGANKNLVAFDNFDTPRVKGVIDPNFSTYGWENSAYEFVDGQIVYPPLTDQYGRDISFEELAIVTHLNFKSEGILHHPVRFRDLQLASLVLNREQLTEVGTKFGLPIYPYYKFGNYYEVKSKNPYSIYKGSTPHLYLNRHSGIRIRGDFDPLIDRGVAIPVNSGESPDTKISALQMWLRYSDRVFPTGETEIFSIKFLNGSYYFYLTGDASTQRGYITVKDENDVPVTDLEFYVNGRNVDVPYMVNEEWMVFGISFPTLLDFSLYAGSINLNGPLTYNNIAYYLSTNLQEAQSTIERSWSSVLTNTWDYWENDFTWLEMLALSTTSRYYVNPAEIYDKYVGTNRIIIDDEVDGILVDPEKFAIFGETEWQTSVRSAA